MAVWNVFQKQIMIINTGVRLVLFQKKKPKASNSVVVVSVRSNIVPSTSVWYMYSETRAGFKVCVICLRFACSLMLQTCHSSSMPLYVARLWVGVVALVIT